MGCMRTGRYTPESFTAGREVLIRSSVRISHVRISPLSLNSFGSSRLPLIPRAKDGRSLCGVLASSAGLSGSLRGSTPFEVFDSAGLLFVKGILNGGMLT